MGAELVGAVLGGGRVEAELVEAMLGGVTVEAELGPRALNLGSPKLQIIIKTQIKRAKSSPSPDLHGLHDLPDPPHPVHGLRLGTTLTRAPGVRMT